MLFAGTPCQTAGLKSYLKKEYENLFTVDFVCHGVPSPEVWKNYVKYRSEQDNEGELPYRINLRSKHTGWSRYHYSNLYEYAGEKKYSAQSSSDLFMRLFVGDYINRESCADCQFKGYDRVSDITLGDFWGIWDIAPEMDDDQGTSLVLTHSEKGNWLLEKIAGNIKLKEVSLEEASRQNPSLIRSSQSNIKRAYALEKGMGGEFEEFRSLFQNENGRSLKQWLRKILKRNPDQ